MDLWDFYQEFEEDHQLSIEVNKFIEKALLARIPSASSLPHQYILPTEVGLRTPRISKLFFQDFLNTTGEDLGSGTRVSATLDEIWVEPGLQLTSGKQARNGVIGSPYSVDNLLASICEGAHCLLIGGETSGKTSLCKTLFIRLFEQGYFPAFLYGERINNPDPKRFEARLRAAYAEQYEDIQHDELTGKLRDRQVIIVDDFDLVRLTAVNRDRLLSGICQQHARLVLTAAPTLSYSLIERVSSKPPVLHRVEILEFGKHKRYSLIDRWCLVEHPNLDEESLRAIVESKRRTIDRVLASNLVPRTPLVVLILLKAIEAGQAGDLAHAGYVRYYKFLIDSAILRNVSKEDAEGAYALLPEIAWAMYASASRELVPQEVESVIEDFAQRRALRKPSLYSVLGSLRSINMFDALGGSLRFKYTYTYYFFLGDYISKNLHKSEMQQEVRSLCSAVSNKKSADILVFLAFHTKSPIIIDTLVEGLSTLYPDAQPFELSKARNAALNKLIYEMPKQVVDYTKTEERRAQHLDAEAAMEAQTSEAETPKELGHGGPINSLMTTLRAVDILGHIVRNHYTRLDAQPKIKIIEAATGATLRCLGDMFDHLSQSVDRVVTAVRLTTKELDQEGDEGKKQEIAEKVVFIIAAGLLIFFGKSLARAVGDENLEITYQAVLGNAPQVIGEYIDVLIKLDCFRQFPLREVRTLVEKISDNQLGMVCLRLAVIERLDMRPPGKPADLQRFCDAVGLQILPRLVARRRR